ncbi:MAG TPA: M15 family metallopeptidase [Acidimicrobiales bacterium]|nr:M15 family metallopeptidase [Acidimicrobiales bacterium]
MAPPTQALPTQEEPTLPHAGDVAADVDVFKADDGDVVDALNNVHGNLRTELRELETARSQLATARDQKAKADQAVAAARKRIDDLTAQSDGVVVDAFMNPPADTALDAMGAASTGDASLKASIVGMQHDADASILARLHDAHQDLAAQKAAQDDAARRAAATADEASAALKDLEAAQSQEAAFVLEVQARLDQNLAEAEALAAIDPALAAQPKAQESEIATGLEAIRNANEQRRALEALRKAQADAAERRAAEERAAAEAAAQAGSLGPATGSLSTVACPGGGSITVDSSLAANLSGLLGAASAAGLNMCGGGYRDPAQQVALRRAHCGSSDYAIYQAPSSACSPPTARPGTSMHEQGLAIDVTCGGGTISRGSACFGWLQGHAAGYGLHNLPSEPWHWSVDGS